MTSVRPAGIPGRALRVAIAALGALWLTGCSDGYPTEDVAQIDPALMTQPQLLAALNAAGQEPHLGQRWRYALHAPCELEVSVRDGGTHRRRVVLEGAQVTTRSVDGVSEIRLIPRTGGEEQALTVLKTRRWSDTVRVRSLLTHLQLRCDASVAPQT